MARRRSRFPSRWIGRRPEIGKRAHFSAQLYEGFPSGGTQLLVCDSLVSPERSKNGSLK
jgi:hypothetical protein